MRQDLAFLFPGQGSQRIGMLAEAAERFSSVRHTFDEASDALDFDLWALIQTGEAETLNLTEHTQPALLTSSVALWRAWVEEEGVKPFAMAGHSLGEFSALCCAGVIGLADAVRLVRERGRFMQHAVPVGEGAMAAIIGLDDEAVLSVCSETATASGATVEAVNFNAPGQVVIAGAKAAVDAAITALSEAGAKRALPLPVSAPFHTSLMKPAGEQLAQVLQDVAFAAPEIPVVNNVNAEVENDPALIRELLVAQISSPVRWTACMGTLSQMGAQRFVECGAGKVLGGLVKRIDRTLSCSYTEQPEALLAARDELAADVNA